MIVLQDLIDLCRAQSIANALYGGEDATWRYICREYSRTFHTPLHIVKQLEPEEVILEFFSNQMDDVKADDQLDSLLDQIYTLEDPNYAKEVRDELRNFMKQAEAEEEARVKSGKAIHPAIKREDEVSLKAPESTPDPEPSQLQDRPSGGSVDLSYFQGDSES